MKRILKAAAVIFILAAFSVTSAAYVYTSTAEDANAGSIYVYGNDDMFPIEYYDSGSGEYEGVLPEVLKTVSERTGLDFTYIKGDRKGIEPEIISSHVFDGSADAEDAVSAVAYIADGKNVSVGFSFTSEASEEHIELIKNEVERISENEINGFFVEGTIAKNEREVSLLRYGGIISAVSAAALIAALVLFIRSYVISYRVKMYDSETGVPNYYSFESRFEKESKDFDKKPHFIAYIKIDDNYLQVYRSEVALLNIVKYSAGVISSFTSKRDIYAKTGEYSFAVVFGSLTPAFALERLKTVMDRLLMYTEYGGKADKSFFRAALYELSSADRNAELTLFNLARNCNQIIGTNENIVVCNKEMMNSATEEKLLKESILHGFDKGEFKLYTQFIVDNKTKKIVSSESLARWKHPEKGLLLPGGFIGDIERLGFSAQLDLYMFERACIQLHKWNETELGHLSLSCNLTRITLSEESFADKVKEISDRYVFNHKRLILEITEDALEMNMDNAKYNVVACKKMGFRVALDDMGSGYTSLSNLCDYPIDIVKIDRDILLKAEGERGRKLLLGMIAIAHGLGIEVVCEGVETEEQVRFVESTDCDYIQGWYYSRALPVKDGEAFFKNYMKADKENENIR